MLEAIKNFVLGIWEGVTTLVDGVATMVGYVVTLVRDIAWIVAYIGKLITSGFADWFDWLPDVCVSVIIACVGVAVVYKILGRE